MSVNIWLVTVMWLRFFVILQKFTVVSTTHVHHLPAQLYYQNHK